MSSCPKVALVTGSTQGIGLAIAHVLAKNGVNVIVTGFGDEASISGIVNDIKTKYGVRVDYIGADLSKLSDIESLWSSTTKIYPAGVDILINNAGVVHYYPTEHFPDDKWNQEIAVMLTAPFQLIKRCVPLMKTKAYGRIVNISSTLGTIGIATAPAYVAAKHGLIGLTKGVALETAAHGITCNAVCPGLTHTPMYESEVNEMLQAQAEKTGVSFEETHKNFLSMVTLTGKLNTVEQIAEMVEFLCLSNASSQMTGAAYLVDPGSTAQ